MSAVKLRPSVFFFCCPARSRSAGCALVPEARRGSYAMRWVLISTCLRWRKWWFSDLQIHLVRKWWFFDLRMPFVRDVVILWSSHDFGKGTGNFLTLVEEVMIPWSPHDIDSGSGDSLISTCLLSGKWWFFDLHILLVGELVILWLWWGKWWFFDLHMSLLEELVILWSSHVFGGESGDSLISTCPWCGKFWFCSKIETKFNEMTFESTNFNLVPKVRGL